MEGCDSSVILGKDNGRALSQHQQWTELSSTHLPSKPANMEPSAVENHGALDNRRAPFSEHSPESAAISGCSAEPASKEVCCNECSTSFASLQSYMEHHCPSARPLFPLQEDCGSDTGEEGDEESDV